MRHPWFRSAALALLALSVIYSTAHPATDKVYRIAMLAYLPATAEIQQIKSGLKRKGYIEGVNTVYLVRNGADHSGAKDWADSDVVDIVQWQPDLIIGLNTNESLALKKNPDVARFPVFFWSADAVASGLATSYRHPGRNITGYSSRPAPATLYLRMLKLSIPNFKRMGHLVNEADVFASSDQRDLEEAGKLYNVDVKRYSVINLIEVDRAFVKMKVDGMQAVKIGLHDMFNGNGPAIGRLALKHGLAAVGPESVVVGGGLASVVSGRNWDAVLPTLDKILKGANPADIPIQRNWPPRVTLNLDSAQQLGLKIPDSLIDQVDVVIPLHARLNRNSANQLGLDIPEGVIDLADADAAPALAIAPTRQPIKHYRIAVLSYESVARFAELQHSLELLGLKEGVNVEYMKREGHRNGDPNSGAKQRVAAAVKEIVAWHPDLIIQMNTNAGVAIKANPDTASIPVIGWSTYAVGAGFANSYRHPGMNFTGFSSAPETSTYYMRLLKQTVPDLKRIGHLYNPGYVIADEELAEFKSAAALMGVTVKTYLTATRSDFEKSIAQMKKDGMQAIHVGPHETFHVFGEEIGALALKYKLPAIGRDTITRGGGIATIDLGWNWAPVIPNILKVLQGTNPGDIPIERNYAPLMTLNLKSAQQLGLKFSDELLEEADSLIE